MESSELKSTHSEITECIHHVLNNIKTFNLLDKNNVGYLNGNKHIHVAK